MKYRSQPVGAEPRMGIAAAIVEYLTSAWWDYVDDIASHRVGPILRSYPAPMRRKMLSWGKSNNLWKRRTAILCQLGFNAETDL